MHHNIKTTQACLYVDLQSIDYMQADPPRHKDSSSIRLHVSSAICETIDREIIDFDASASLLIETNNAHSRHSILGLLVPVASFLLSADLVNRCRFVSMPASWFVTIYRFSQAHRFASSRCFAQTSNRFLAASAVKV